MFYRTIQFIPAVKSTLFYSHDILSEERWDLNCFETLELCRKWDCIWQRCPHAPAKKSVPSWVSHILRMSPGTRFHPCSLDVLSSLLVSNRLCIYNVAFIWGAWEVKDVPSGVERGRREQACLDEAHTCTLKAMALAEGRRSPEACQQR